MTGDWIKEALKRQMGRTGRTCKPNRAASELSSAGSTGGAPAATVHYPRGFKSALAVFCGPTEYSKAAGVWAFMPNDARREALECWSSGHAAADAVAAYLERHYRGLK